MSEPQHHLGSSGTQWAALDYLLWIFGLLLQLIEVPFHYLRKIPLGGIIRRIQQVQNSAKSIPFPISSECIDEDVHLKSELLRGFDPLSSTKPMQSGATSDILPCDTFSESLTDEHTTEGFVVPEQSSSHDIASECTCFPTEGFKSITSQEDDTTSDTETKPEQESDCEDSVSDGSIQCVVPTQESSPGSGWHELVTGCSIESDWTQSFHLLENPDTDQCSPVYQSQTQASKKNGTSFTDTSLTTKAVCAKPEELHTHAGFLKDLYEEAVPEQTQKAAHVPPGKDPAVVSRVKGGATPFTAPTTVSDRVDETGNAYFPHKLQKNSSPKLHSATLLDTVSYTDLVATDLVDQTKDKEQPLGSGINHHLRLKSMNTVTASDSGYSPHFVYRMD